MSSEIFMRRAIELARHGMRAGHGGPFGAVVVRDGDVLGEGWNQVIRNNDPTAHGEIVAIRDACARQGNFALDRCEIYSSGEPCPMCFGAIHWARIGRIHYGFGVADAEALGFDDRRFFAEFGKPPAERAIHATPLLADEARALLGEYAALPGKQGY